MLKRSTALLIFIFILTLGFSSGGADISTVSTFAEAAGSTAADGADKAADVTDQASGGSQAGGVSEISEADQGSRTGSETPPESGVSRGIPAGYDKVAETDYLELYFTGEKPSIIVRDKRSGYLWSSAVLDGNIGKTTNNTWKTAMNSIFVFQYTDFKNQTKLTNSTSEKSEIKTASIKNGISIDFSFTNIKIGLKLNIWLEDKSLNVFVPADSLAEKGNFGLINVEMLPFLGAAGDKESGYMFYPDGSGALMYFKDIPHAGASKYSWSIYGPEDPESFFTYDAASRQAALPVYGGKIGDSAFLAVVNRGEAYSSINLSQSGYILNANRISADFKYRRLYNDSINLSDINNPQGKNLLKLEKELLKIDHGIKYMFLTGEDADYSGMANAYRDYLVSEGGISRKIPEGGKISLGLDLFMGIKEERMLFDKYVPMTTFKQSEDIINELMSMGVDDMQVNLVGWEREGYLTGWSQLPAAGGLGGSGDLKLLSEFTRKLGIPLTLQVDYTDAIRKYGGFSMRNDVVYNKAGFAVTDQYRNWFLLNPIRAWSSFSSSYLPELAGYGVDGISFDNLGGILYHDFNDRYPINRQDAIGYWKKFMAETQKRLGFAAVSGGNAYVLGCVDRLMDIAYTDGGSFFTDQSIPFYQMVVHGMIPYTAGPANLFYDYGKQKLNWVEYGYMPYFMLTYEKPQLLKYTKYNRLFNSDYREWAAQCAELYKEFNSRLGGIWDKVMLKHQKLGEDLFKVTYEGGTSVYVNYGGSPAEIEGHTVKGMDYLVVEQGGLEK